MPAEPSTAEWRCAVLGSPIAHSLSPVLHRAAYLALGLDWTYDAFDVTEDRLAGFLAGLSSRWRGLSLTMPLKRAVVELCDEVSAQARLLSSVNTVVLGVGGQRCGHNTDVTGFVRAFHEAGVRTLGSVLVVGAGATAASSLAAAAELGARRATVLARSPQRASALTRLGPALGLEVYVRPLDLPLGPPADAVVCTLPPDGRGAIATAELASLAPIVFDVVYAPARTPLIEAACDAGAQAIGGFALLVHQAARQVELMTGVDEAPLEAMRTAGLAALGNR
jgi:shikimate dehydrogenase